MSTFRAQGEGSVSVFWVGQGPVSGLVSVFTGRGQAHCLGWGSAFRGRYQYFGVRVRGWCQENGSVFGVVV